MKKHQMICTRSVDFLPITADDNTQSDGRTLEGYAAVWNSPTEINSWEGRFVEQIAPGAFRKTLAERKPVMQYNHGHDARVGTVPIGVYTQITEDERGLHVVGRLFDNAVVEPVRQAIEAGAVSGMSFAFEVVRDEWTDNAGKPVSEDELYRLLYEPRDRGPLQRTIREVRLREAGPVLNPAYADTSVGVRSADELSDAEREAIAAEYRRTMAEVDTAVRETEQAQTDLTDAHREAAETIEEIREEIDPPVVEETRDAPITDLDKYDLDGDDTGPVEYEQSHVDGVINPEADDEDHLFEDGMCVTCGTNHMRSDDKPYGDVSYADPKNGKYPIDTKAHVRAAWSYINMPKNQKSYSSDELSAIKSRIKAAAKKFGIEINDSEEKSAEVSAVHRDTLTDQPEIPESDAALEGTLQTRESPTEKEIRADEAPVIVRKRILTLTELRQRLAEIDARTDEINTEYRDAELSAEIETEFAELRDERPKIEARIEKILARMAELEGAAADTGRTERTFSSAPSAPRKPENIYDLGEIRAAAHGEEDYLGLVRDNAKRAIERGQYSRMASREDAQGHAEMLLDTIDDETGTLAHRFLKTGSPLYERAWSKAVAAGTPQLLSGEEYRALSLGTDGSGGYAVPFQLDPSVILTSAGVINPLRDISRVEQIVGKEWMGVVSAGVSVSRAAEAAEASDNSFTLTQPTVRTNRVQGFIPFSYELAESWAQVRNEITRALVDAKGREEANSFMNGDGTGLNAGGVIGTLSGGSLVAATSGQAFTAADVYHLEESLDPRWRTPDAKFIAHRAIYNKIRQFDQYGGAQLWQRIGAGMPAELLGYSALESSVMDSTHATGDLFLLFGNFQQFLIVDRIGMSVELIPQVFGANQRPTGQRGIYAIWMNNSAVLVPGAFKALQGTA
jgi:HK97 family phage major capsid protein/HK97 family phage prohead protease